MHQLTGVEGSIIVSIIDFALVFIILGILALIMYSFRFVFAERKKKPEIVEIEGRKAPAPTVVEGEDEEVVAVIMGAISSYLGYLPKSFTVKRVLPTKSVSMWKLTARREAVGMDED